MKARWQLLGVLAALVACSPTIRVQTRLELPGVDAPRLDRLHVRARAACPSYDVTAPPPPVPEPPEPGPTEDPSEDGAAVDAEAPGDAGTNAARSERLRVVVPNRDGLEVNLSIHGTRCTVAMTAWYDADGDGRVGPGDLVGALPATEVLDRGLCRGNMNVVGPLRLAAR